MTPLRAFNALILSAEVMAAIILTAYVGPVLLDGHTDHSAEMATAASLDDAIKKEAAQARFARAASQICGENAGWSLTADNSLQCTTKRGFKTRKVAL